MGGIKEGVEEEGLIGATLPLAVKLVVELRVVIVFVAGDMLVIFFCGVLVEDEREALCESESKSFWLPALLL